MLCVVGLVVLVRREKMHLTHSTRLRVQPNRIQLQRGFKVW